jgi:hypothetical protein
MALFPLGILSAAGAGAPVGPPGDYELISTTILTSSVGSISFSSLGTYSSTYKHLQIRYVASASIATRMGLTINGAGSGYRSHGLFARGSSVASYDSFASDSGFYMRAAQDLSTALQAGVIDILDPFSTTKNKTVRVFYGQAVSSDNSIGLISGFLNSTSSVTSISLAPSDFTSFSNANFAIGSRFSIYGVKG